MSLVRAAWRGYTGALSRRPYATSSATGGLVMLSGDSLAQRFEQRHHAADSGRASGGGESKHDRIRAAVMVGFSMGAFMPLNTLWYRNVVERCGPTRTRTHARTHTRTHARTHTRTHTLKHTLFLSLSVSLFLSLSASFCLFLACSRSIALSLCPCPSVASPRRRVSVLLLLCCYCAYQRAS
jgi:hypothetical protein